MNKLYYRFSDYLTEEIEHFIVNNKGLTSMQCSRMRDVNKRCSVSLKRMNKRSECNVDANFGLNLICSN